MRVLLIVLSCIGCGAPVVESEAPPLSSDRASFDELCNADSECVEGLRCLDRYDGTRACARLCADDEECPTGRDCLLAYHASFVAPTECGGVCVAPGVAGMLCADGDPGDCGVALGIVRRTCAEGFSCVTTCDVENEDCEWSDSVCR